MFKKTTLSLLLALSPIAIKAMQDVDTAIDETGTTQCRARIVQALLDEQARADVMNRAEHYGQTPLFRAKVNAHVAIVHALLADPNKAEHYGRTPLRIARTSHIERVEPLLPYSESEQYSENE